MDRRVPGDAVAVGPQKLVDLRDQGRVLDPGLRERLHHTGVEGGVGLLIYDRAPVETLEVDGVDRAGLAQLRDQVAVPVRRRVQLEAEGWVGVEAAADRVDRGRVAEAQR